MNKLGMGQRLVARGGQRTARGWPGLVGGNETLPSPGEMGLTVGRGRQKRVSRAE